jgi:predicted DNA-binding transcriptional regulator YafY
MCFGENIRAEFRADKSMISDIIDVFGKDVRFSGETDTQITVTANVNQMAMEQFALSFAPWIEVIKPQKLREKMIEDLSAGLEKYKD